MRRLFFGLYFVGMLGTFLLYSGGSGTRAQVGGKKSSQGLIYKVEISGPISPSTLEQLVKAVEKANRDGAQALLVLLNTPGGYMQSMDKMCSKILNSKVPVITFVYPPGSYAGSAGVFIMYASHLAAMAPATNLGSATPVMSGGGGGKKKDGAGSDRIPDKAGADDHMNLKRKLFNHARGQIKSFAQFHGRNPDFAERTITHAANVTYRRAFKLGAIELIADSPEKLLEKAHGREVQMVGHKHVLNLKGAKVVPIKTDFRTDFLAFITNPVIVNLLMMIGVLGIMAEIQYPGSIFPGAIGAICLILGLYAMQSLPINYAGFGLILLGVVFFILEIKIVSYGMLSIAGIICLVIGSILLAQSGDELVWSTLAVILTTTGLIAAVMLVLVYKAAQVLRKKPVGNLESVLGGTAVAETRIDEHEGEIFVNSELWSARAARPGIIIEKDATVKIVRREGMMLFVDRVSAGEASPETTKNMQADSAVYGGTE